MGTTPPLQFLDDAVLWKELARKARGPRRVAVPYVGEGASDLLPWKKGDVLVCALSTLNARAGNVCPAEIYKLLKRGVRVYVEPDLHAKVVRFTGHAIVGSANLSRRSRDKLDEAGVVVRDAVALKAIDLWFSRRMGAPVTPGLLAACKKAYRKPKWPPLGEPGDGQPELPAKEFQRSAKLWIITTQPLDDFPPDEQTTATSARTAATKKLRKPRTHGIDCLRWQGSRFGENAKPEDLVIQVWNDRGQHVSPHGRVLSVRRRRTKHGGKVAYICIEYPRLYLDDPIDKRIMTLAVLKKECARLTIKLASRDIEREVRNPAARRVLLGLCSPELVA